MWYKQNKHLMKFEYFFLIVRIIIYILFPSKHRGVIRIIFIKVIKYLLFNLITLPPNLYLYYRELMVIKIRHIGTQRIESLWRLLAKICEKYVWYNSKLTSNFQGTI